MLGGDVARLAWSLCPASVLGEAGPAALASSAELGSLSCGRVLGGRGPPHPSLPHSAASAAQSQVTGGAGDLLPLGGAAAPARMLERGAGPLAALETVGRGSRLGCRERVLISL